jgi:Fumarylacetoacetate (FAA) hydrolase family
MKLCMFHPKDRVMQRGWVGRIDGDRVIHLAAQTLQSFFTGGGAAREHAEYPGDAVTLLVPVLHPPTVRLFETEQAFVFGNANAVTGPGATVTSPAGPLTVVPRLAAVIAASETIGGWSAFVEWRAGGLSPPKDRDFALGLGPVVVTPDELSLDGIEAVVRIDGEEKLRARVDRFDWQAARAVAARNTVLRPGDVLAGPALGETTAAAGPVEVEVEGIGVLGAEVAPR